MNTVTLLQIVKLLNRTMNVVIRYNGEEKTMDAWVLAACENMPVKSIDVMKDGYLITVESCNVGFGLGTLLGGYRGG